MAVTFSTSVFQAPGMNATGLPVPDTAIQELGSSRKPAVTVTIGTYSSSSTVSYRSTVSSRQGGYILPLSSIHRDATGLSAGDEVVVTLDLDQSPRQIEIPLDLAEALSQRARSAFDALSASRRGAFVHQVESAKAADTRARRVARIATQLDECPRRT
ncbi:MAG: DUF1905 domain-containing protein [Salinibacterium sp.]|nr:DUF1905 domain-containing protein [Salinibacterium sp.]